MRLFPVEILPDWSRMPLWADADPGPVLFTLEELRQAATRLPSGKAPDPDGVFNEMLSGVVR